MMLQMLIGLRVLDAELIHDYLNIKLESDVVLNVMNTYHLNPEGASAKDLNMQLVSKITEHEKLIWIEFSSGILLSIDLSDAAFKGPEAIGLYRPGQPIIIWN